MADWIGLPAVSDVTEESITLTPLSAREVVMLAGMLGGSTRWKAFEKQAARRVWIRSEFRRLKHTIRVTKR